MTEAALNAEAALNDKRDSRLRKSRAYFVELLRLLLDYLMKL